MAAVIEIEELAKTFSLGLIRLQARKPGEPKSSAEQFFESLPGEWGKRLHHQKEAVKNVSFQVQEGEIFGFLGPNGAGKTTTIKMLLGLIFPTSGTARLFGKHISEPEARRRVGYLPENPYLYQYLTAVELMDLCGRLVGLPTEERRDRSRELIHEVGLDHAADTQVRKYSKGMMQRLGIAQALLGDPDLLILDEPMTGLDPIGRREVRELMLKQQKRGKTLLFSSHILSDVETVCNRVAIMHRGELRLYGRLEDLLRRDVQLVEMEFEKVSDALAADLTKRFPSANVRGGVLHLTIEGAETAQAVLNEAQLAGARVLSMQPRRESLEDLFLRNALVSG